MSNEWRFLSSKLQKRGTNNFFITQKTQKEAGFTLLLSKVLKEESAR